MVQSMAASDVAVMLREDSQLGLPQYCSLIKGLDFQHHFASQQLGNPMAGKSILRILPPPHPPTHPLTLSPPPHPPAPKKSEMVVMLTEKGRTAS